MSTVTAMRRSNPWATRALSMRGIETQEVEGDGDIKVMVDTLYFTNHGPKSNYRPALHIRGRLVGLAPYDTPEIAYGVTEVTFDDQTEGEVPTVDAFYEFTDEQLVVLVGKGYFNEGFEPPSDLIDQVWTLPARYQALVIAPEHDSDAPLVFVDVIDRDGLLIDSEMSGLFLSDYFPDYLSYLRERREAGSEYTVDPSMERTSEIDDVFEGQTFGEYEAGDEGVGQPEGSDGRVEETETSKLDLPTMGSPLFEALMRDARKKYGEDFLSKSKPAEESQAEETAETEQMVETEQIEQAAEPTESETVEEERPSRLASVTRGELGESFKSVMGEFISRSVVEHTPGGANAGLGETATGAEVETEAESGAEPVEGTGVSEEKAKVAESVDRVTERKRVSVREAVENAAPTTYTQSYGNSGDIDPVDLGDDEPEL